jgi:pimeloyl-ACP methyl ester carboxylesterase
MRGWCFIVHSPRTPPPPNDAVGLLDVLKVTKVYTVGLSLGRGISQRIVLEYTNRIASLTLIPSSPRVVLSLASSTFRQCRQRIDQVHEYHAFQSVWSRGRCRFHRGAGVPWRKLHWIHSTKEERLLVHSGFLTAKSTPSRR